jgi:hypothetical protein
MLSVKTPSIPQAALHTRSRNVDILELVVQDPEIFPETQEFFSEKGDPWHSASQEKEAEPWGIAQAGARTTQR